MSNSIGKLYALRSDTTLQYIYVVVLQHADIVLMYCPAARHRDFIWYWTVSLERNSAFIPIP